MFLKMKLDELYKSRKIDMYCFISHLPEEEELKQHIHLAVNPNIRIDTRDLDDFLSEPDDNNDKPLGTCGIWYIIGKNNFYDWLLYVLHDLNYCHLKGYPDRKYVYSKYDFITSNQDYIINSVYEAYHQSNFAYNRTILDLVQNVPAKEIVKSGYININNMANFRYLTEFFQAADSNIKNKKELKL